MHADDGKRKCSKEAESGEIEYIDDAMAKAMAHPLRVQIVGVLNKQVMSPSGFARTYDVKLQNASYHFRFLKEHGLIEEAGSRPVRGSTEHFYRAVKSDERMAVWVQQRLDEQGWVEAVAAQRELVHKMEDIYKGSRLRLLEAGEPEGGMLGTFGVFLFESPPFESERHEDEDA